MNQPGYRNYLENLLNKSDSDILEYPLTNQPPARRDDKIWEDIMSERNVEIMKFDEYMEEKRLENPAPDIPPNPDLQFLEDKIFPVLIPILEDTLIKAKLMACIKHQKSIFNGIDYIAERLWNSNKQYPQRSEERLNIHLIPWAKEWLEEHPRPIFPLHWIWSKKVAAIRIQKAVRGYNVRKQEEVQEMRQFWRTLEQERREKEEEEKARREKEDEQHVTTVEYKSETNLNPELHIDVKKL